MYLNLVTVHRFRVKDKEGIKDPKFLYETTFI
jgi:hypothetical protein